jgi:Bacterial Ig-like domain
MLHTASRMIKRSFPPFLVCLSVLLLLGCSENTPSSEETSSATGTIAFNIVMGDRPDDVEGTAIPRAISDECGTTTQFEISGVGATVYSSPPVTGSWSCSAGSGVLSNVSPGNNLRLVIIGYNASAFGNRTVYSGETRVNVSAGLTTAPTVVAELFSADKISPAQDATGVDPDSVTFTWSPASGADSYVIELYDRADSSDPDRVVVFSQEVTGTSYTYNGGLAENTTYYWGVFPVDIAGDSAYDYGFWGFTTAGGVADNEPPTVIANIPTGSDEPLDAGVGVTFSERMDLSTITEETFLVDNGVTAIEGIITLVDSETFTMAIFTPTVDLEPGVTYMALIVGGSPGGVRDVAGNYMAADFTWSFTTTLSPASGLIWDQGSWDTENWN